MTVQALADRCAELGLPLGRVTITKLEGGKRQAITPAEVAVLAAVLGVAPVELLYTVGHGEQAEVLPGRAADATDAARWFGGELNLELTDTGPVIRVPKPGEQTGIELLRDYYTVGSEWVQARAEAIEAIAATQAPRSEGADERAREDAAYKVAVAERNRKNVERVLHKIRADLRDRGVPLPPVPPGLSLPGDDEEPLPRSSAERDGP